jgi:hypothetical protein
MKLIIGEAAILYIIMGDIIKPEYDRGVYEKSVGKVTGQ